MKPQLPRRRCKTRVLPAADARTALERIERLFRRSPAVVFLWRVAPGWPVDYVSPNIIQFGYTVEECVSGKVSWPSATHPDDMPRIEAETMQYIAAGQKEFTQHYRIRTKSGEVRWIEDQTCAVCDAAGKLTHLQGCLLDVTARKHAEDAYQTLAAHPLQGMNIVVNGRVVFANRTFEELTGFSGPELLAMSPVELFNLVHPDDRALVRKRYQDRLAGKPAPSQYELRMVRKDGNVRWVAMYVVRVEYRGQTAVQGTYIDITERKQADLALRRRNEQLEILRQIDKDILEVRPVAEIAQAALHRLRQIVPCSRVSVSLLNETSKSSEIVALESDVPTNVNPGVAFPIASLRRAIRELRHKRVLRAVPGDRMVEWIPPLALMWAEGMQCFLGLPLLFRGQLIGIMNLYARETAAFSSEETEIAREVADRLAIAVKNVQLVQSVQEQSERLRALRARLAATEEAERRKLAVELHDQVGASLSALGLNLAVLHSRFGSDLARTEAGNLRQAIDQVEQITAHVRNVMADLRPPVLDDYGLIAALHWFAAEYRERTGIPVQVHGEEPKKRLAQEVEVSLFRVAQEALTNVAKHARASEVEISVEVHRGSTCLAIADNGCGFDPPRQSLPQKNKGWGMMAMRERVEAAGGTLQVVSTRGRGTTVTATVPRTPRS